MNRAAGAVPVDLPGVGSLGADLTEVAADAPVVVFAHGSGSSRHSPRNRAVADRLNRAGFATLLMDLLTDREEAADRCGGRFRFDVQALADRLTGAVDWLDARSASRRPLGYFGASTGAAAALVAAAGQRGRVGAVVSRGGRPDLAGEALAAVTAPTLLIVGARDITVLRLNEQALARLPGERRLATVPGATHLFEEPGALERVAELAVEWFTRHLPTTTVGGPAARPR